MAKRKKKKSSAKKRTISADQQAKMQEGRRQAAVHRDRVEKLDKSGLDVRENVSRTERMLEGVRRK